MLFRIVRKETLPFERVDGESTRLGTAGTAGKEIMQSVLIWRLQLQRIQQISQVDDRTHGLSASFTLHTPRRSTNAFWRRVAVAWA